MGTESETERHQLDTRLTRIEERVGQLLLDRTTLLNSIANLRRTVQTLENYKLMMQTRDKDSEKRFRRTIAWIGVLITISQVAVQIVFRLWPSH